MKTFTRSSIDRMLQNPIYIGKINHHGTLYDGQHEAIISETIFYGANTKKSSKETRLSAIFYEDFND